jgi:hypothetical protein
MRTLHEITQLWLCRILFIAAGIVPTVAVLAWAGVVQTSWHQSMYERQTSQLLDSQVTFSSIGFPRPGVTRIKDFTLHDSQTDQELVQIATLEVIQHGDDCVIHGDLVKMLPDTHDALAQWFVRALRSKLDTPTDKIRITLEQVQIDGGDDVIATCKIIADRIQTENGARLNVAVVPAGVETRRVAMSFLHDRQDKNGNIRLVVDAEATPLPCAWIDSIAMHVGKKATFQGKFWARLPAGTERWYVDALAGEFAKIDLEQLTKSLGNEQLSGTASANIRGALFKEGHLHKVAGSIDVGGGSISNQLVHRLAKHLELKSTFDLKLQAGHTDFDRLALAFALDAEGLMIEGRANDSFAALVSESGTLASVPTCDAVPVAQFLRAIAHPDTPLVPAHSAVPWLADFIHARSTETIVQSPDDDSPLR